MTVFFGHPRDANPHQELYERGRWKGGYKEWYLNGKLHRVDGPAVVKENGRHRWYLKGYMYSFDEWADRVKISNEERIELKLIYG